MDVQTYDTNASNGLTNLYGVLQAHLAKLVAELFGGLPRLRNVFRAQASFFSVDRGGIHAELCGEHLAEHGMRVNPILSEVFGN